MRTTAFIRSTAIRATAIAALAVAPTVMAEDPPANYVYCMGCHMQGVAGAPKTGDAEAWAPRMAQGLDALVATVKMGKGAMPAGGLCNESCSDEDYAAIIIYMATAQ